MTSKIADIKRALAQIDTVANIPEEWLSDSRKGVQDALTSWHKQQAKKQQQLEKLEALFTFEKELWQQGYQAIAGVDEVGRGPLAGPVVAAAVIMPATSRIASVNDSKQLSAQKREALYELICNEALAIGIGIVDAPKIDEINIYQASKQAMCQALDQLAIMPDYVLVDAMQLPIEQEQQSLIKGDARSYSIAAASIVAKVTRDRMMAEYAKVYTQYGFEKNAGYGTAQHLEALATYGLTPLHRLSFEPIKSQYHK